MSAQASKRPVFRLAAGTALLAIAWGGAAFAEGVALEAPMQPIQKRVVPCATCAHSAGFVGGDELLRGQDRAGPEFPAAQHDSAAGDAARGTAPLVDVPSVVGIGAGDPVAAPSMPSTLPAR